MNKVILLGRLTKDPEVRYTQSAEPVARATYSLAVNRRFKREGEPDADFINCVAWRKDAEFCEKYFRKGMMVAVSGRLVTRSYDDKDGKRVYVTEVSIEEQDFAESKASFEARVGNAPREARPYGAPGQPPAAREPEGFSAIAESIDDDDLPF